MCSCKEKIEKRSSATLDFPERKHNFEHRSFVAMWYSLSACRALDTGRLTQTAAKTTAGEQCCYVNITIQYPD